MAKNPDDRFPSAGDLGRAAIAAAAGAVVTEPERRVGVGDAAAETTPISSEAPGTTRTLPTEVMPPRGRRRRRPRRQRRRLWIAAAAVLLALLGGGGIAALELADSGAGAGAQADPRTIEVPGLEGRRLDLAEQDLSALGLRSETTGGGVLGILVDSNWEVCETDPSGGEQVRPRATIKLLVDRPGSC